MTPFEEFYQVRSPSSWPAPPECYSHSLLSRISLCPLRVQLERAEYPGIGRFPSRPNPAAIEGTIIHEGLEEMFKTFSLAGLPDLNSSAGRTCAKSLNLPTLISQKLAATYKRLEDHPGGASCRIRSSAQQLTNKIIRLFRQQYAQLDRTKSAPVHAESVASKTEFNSKDLSEWLRNAGALTELQLQHPELSFRGIIDLVYLKNHEVVIGDYKSGSPKPEHQTQILRYALLWWRHTGNIPAAAEIRYLSELVTFPVSEGDLVRTEQALSESIEEALRDLTDHEAPPRLGAHCSNCDVRQFCNTYWDQPPTSQVTQSGFIDLEVTIHGKPSDHGFEAKTRQEERVSVTCDSGMGRLHFPGIQTGQNLRFVGARFDSKKAEVHLVSSTEVWRVPSVDSLSVVDTAQ